DGRVPGRAGAGRGTGTGAVLRRGPPDRRGGAHARAHGDRHAPAGVPRAPGAAPLRGAAAGARMSGEATMTRVEELTGRLVEGDASPEERRDLREAIERDEGEASPSTSRPV